MKTILIPLLWSGFAISTVSNVLELFDVRHYYMTGRVGTAVAALVLTALYLWLILAIARGQQWAMIAYGVLTVLFLVTLGRGFWCYGFQNVLIGTLDAVSIVIDVVCVILCFLVAEKTPVSSVWSWSLWLAGAMAFLIGTAWHGLRHEGSDEWKADCRRAIAAGSREAQEDFDSYLKESQPGDDKN